MSADNTLPGRDRYVTVRPAAVLRGVRKDGSRVSLPAAIICRFRSRRAARPEGSRFSGLRKKVFLPQAEIDRIYWDTPQ